MKRSHEFEAETDPSASYPVDHDYLSRAKRDEGESPLVKFQRIWEPHRLWRAPAVEEPSDSSLSTGPFGI